MLLAGYSVTEAARLLEISPNTVCGARQRVMEKWEVEGMVGLIKEAIKRGYVELDSDSPLTYRDGNYEESHEIEQDIPRNSRFDWVTTVG